MAGKNKTRLVGWHPSDPAAVAWLDAEIARRGGGRGVQSAVLDEALEAVMTAPVITDHDGQLIARAREAGAELRRRPGDLDRLAGTLLAELADRAERPASTAHPPIHVTTDGDTFWLQCFADDPDAEHGEIIAAVEPGDSWWDLAQKVDQHIIAHGC